MMEISDMLYGWLSISISSLSSSLSFILSFYFIGEHWSLSYIFPSAIVTNYYKLTDLKPCESVPLEFWRSAVWNKFNWNKINVLKVTFWRLKGEFFSFSASRGHLYSLAYCLFLCLLIRKYILFPLLPLLTPFHLLSLTLLWPTKIY